MTDLRRHGDVIILTQKGFKIPADVKLTPGKLIHQGSSNQHVISKGAALFGGDDSKRYIRVEKAATVSHIGGTATHDSKPLPVGDYWYEIQSFYDHLTEEQKQVID